MRSRLLLLVACGLALVGCETEFDPFEESDIGFSVFGVLDTAADTQFVRVADLRNPARPGEPLDATVTLEHLGTGAVVTLRDSVFVFSNGGYAHNLWTAAPIAQDAAYRLTVARPSATTASAVFRTPPTFPNPTLDSGIIPFVTSAENPPELQQIVFTGIETFADLRIRYHLSRGGGTVTISYLDRLMTLPDGRKRVGFNAYEDVQRAIGTPENVCPGLVSAEIFVAAATEEWPDVLDLDPETAALPGTVSNVEGGLGYVGGVEIRTREWGAMAAVFFFHEAGCVVQ